MPKRPCENDLKCETQRMKTDLVFTTTPESSIERSSSGIFLYVHDNSTFTSDKMKSFQVLQLDSKNSLGAEDKCRTTKNYLHDRFNMDIMNLVFLNLDVPELLSLSATCLWMYHNTCPDEKWQHLLALYPTLTPSTSNDSDLTMEQIRMEFLFLASDVFPRPPQTNRLSLRNQILNRYAFLQAQNPTQLCEIGLELAVNREHAAARECFVLSYERSQSCSELPSSIRGYIAYCYGKFLHMVFGDYERAIELYEDALVYLHDCVPLLYALGSLNLCHRMDLKKGNHIDPSPAIAIKYFEDAIFYDETKQLDNANYGTYEPGLKCRLYSGYACALALAGKKRKSVAWYRKAILLGVPQHFNISDLLSYALMLQNDPREFTDTKDAKKFLSYDENCLIVRLRVWKILKQIDMIYRICLSTAPNSMLPNLLYGVYLSWIKQDQERAAHFFKKACAIDSNISKCCEELKRPLFLSSFRQKNERKLFPLIYVDMIMIKGKEPGCRISFEQR